MTQPVRRHASRWRPAESFRQRTITVVALEEEFSGALAYALQRALEEPAAVHAVRVQSVPGPGRVQPPIPVRNLTGDPAAALEQLAARSDLMVVQQPGNGTDPATGQVLADLRRGATTLLVEVDDEGEIVRASGSGGWSYPVIRDRPGLEPGHEVMVLPISRVPVQVGTDHESRVPPPDA